MAAGAGLIALVTGRCWPRRGSCGSGSSATSCPRRYSPDFAGTAITVMTGQLPTMLGISDTHEDQIWNRWLAIARGVDDIDIWACLLSVVALLTLDPR